MTDQQFKEQVFLHTEYDEKLLEQFYDYWSEANKKGKMRFEFEKTWDLSKRLKRWFTNDIKWNNGNKFNQQSNGTHKAGTSAARIDALKNWCSGA